MTLKAKANRKTARAGKPTTLKYQVTAAYANTTKGAAFEKAGVTVTLPATGVTVAKTAVTPRVKLSGGATYPAAVVAGDTVTFADAPLGGHKRRTYTVWLKVGSGATSPLVISSKLTNCDLDANDVSDGPPRRACTADLPFIVTHTHWSHSPSFFQSLLGDGDPQVSNAAGAGTAGFLIGQVPGRREPAMVVAAAMMVCNFAEPRSVVRLLYVYVFCDRVCVRVCVYMFVLCRCVVSVSCVCTCARWSPAGRQP